MALLSVSNLVLSFGDRPILDGVNLTLNPGEHVGLVGANGCGKSTLLKLIAGLETHAPDAGQVQVSRSTSVGYLTQDHNLNPDLTLRQEAETAFAHVHALHDRMAQLAHDMAQAQESALEKLLAEYEQVEKQLHAADGYDLDRRIAATLLGVGLPSLFHSVRVGNLSGGQKGRLALAKLLLAQPDVLLLDEPTNHLDIAGRQWLETFLAQYSGGVVLVSHDRWLLDRVVSKIYELHAGQLEEYPGNYQQFREQRAQRRLAQQRVYEKQRERVRSEQAFIDRYRAGQRARQAQGREKRLERFVRDSLVDRPADLDVMNLRIGPAQRPGDLIVTSDRVCKAYDQKILFHDLSLVIKRGDRVGIIGPNGAGKTTLVNCLLGLLPADAGSVRVGNSVDVGHYRQTHEHLDLSLTVVDYLRQFVMGGSGGLGSEQAARDLAGAFLFSGQDQDKPLSVLSGGERSRVVLAGLVAGQHNLLVLDEPTNHLDIASAERLEEALRQFTAVPQGFGQTTSGGGTLMVITHDRMLLDHLVNQLLIMDGQGQVRHFMGTYSEFLASEQAAAQAQTPTKSPNKPTAKPAVQTRQSSQPTPPAAGKSHSRPGALARLSQESLEKKIVELETKMAKVDQELADPNTYHDGEKVRKLQSQRDRLVQELKPLEEEWTYRAQQAP